MDRMMVTTEDVMLAILEITHQSGDRVFTTLDVAMEMGTDEYPVRTAFGWLLRLGKIECVNGKVIERTTRTSGQRYAVTVYRMKPAAQTTVEFEAFYGRFCGGR